MAAVVERVDRLDEALQNFIEIWKFSMSAALRLYEQLTEASPTREKAKEKS